MDIISWIHMFLSFSVIGYMFYIIESKMFPNETENNPKHKKNKNQSS